MNIKYVVPRQSKYFSALMYTGTISNREIPKPWVSVIGFRTLVVQWKKCPLVTEYAIKCINRSSGKTYIRYTDQTQFTFNNLHLDDMYEFQLAVSENDGSAYVWSEMSFPVKPIMQLGWYI